MARKAWEGLEASGQLVVASAQGGEYESPLFRVWVTANARMEKSLKSLGMTPAALQSLRLDAGGPGKKAEEPEGLTDFL